ncbi:hypothetical protein, partial [Pseudomonas sp. 86_A]|uniref:hypothetical protein n=1 Tax=Pseudomonas sp. 86_A TaxID=2813569 RepID=UPI001A9CED55
SLRMEPMPEDHSGLNLRERLEKVERTLLLDCLRKNDGNQTLATNCSLATRGTCTSMVWLKAPM